MEKQLKYNEPWILQRADPYVYRHTDGTYYFTASVPEYDRIVLRSASHLADLADAEEHEVWHKHESGPQSIHTVSYTHLRAHETGRNLVCRLLLEKKKTIKIKKKQLKNINSDLPI